MPNCKAFVAEKGLQTLIPLIRDKNPKIQISALNAMLRFLEAIGEGNSSSITFSLVTEAFGNDNETGIGDFWWVTLP